MRARTLLKTLLLGAVLLTLVPSIRAEFTSKEEAIAFLSNLNYQKGTVPLAGGIASIQVPKGYGLLSEKEAKTMLTEVWGNPPNDSVVGLLCPPGFNPADPKNWFIALTYSPCGYVPDKDCQSINYTEVLKSMQDSCREENAERTKKGYPTAILMGWAAAPHYDPTSHKIYWAKDIKFSDAETNTLNYDVCILGRKGILSLTAVTDTDNLKEMEAVIPTVLEAVNFVPGNLYADFNPKVDEMAGFGLAALVAGGVAAKMGFFKWILVILLSLKKFLIIAVIGFIALLKKFFSKPK